MTTRAEAFYEQLLNSILETEHEENYWHISSASRASKVTKDNLVDTALMLAVIIINKGA